VKGVQPGIQTRPSFASDSRPHIQAAADVGKLSMLF
jgi:hypothetical protein